MTATHPTIFNRPAAERGRTDLGWLDSQHTFSFGRFHDPQWMGYRSLRVINDDRVAPGAGFGEHGHDNMEILSWVVDGALTHRDSLGHQASLTPGMLQAMSAGTGIRHSEFNGSNEAPVRFLQIWIEPDQAGHAPRYEDRLFDAAGRDGQFQLLASPTGEADSLPIHQDARVYVANLSAGQQAELTLTPGRGLWLQAVTGTLQANGQPLHGGDGRSIEHSDRLAVTGEGQILAFDLA